MGHLRMEPIDSVYLSDTEYQHYNHILRKARGASQNHHIYWELEKSEDIGKVRMHFIHVAKQEGIPVAIRKARGSHSLAFSFKQVTKQTPRRIPASECRRRILTLLAKSNKPLKKSEIIKTTGISPSTWNMRINELVSSGQVHRMGERRDTLYCLPN